MLRSFGGSLALARAVARGSSNCSRSSGGELFPLRRTGITTPSAGFVRSLDSQPLAVRYFHQSPSLRVDLDDSDYIRMSRKQFLGYKIGSAALIGLVSAILIGVWIPQLIMTVEGDAIDSPPKSFTKPCRQDYRLLLYSEAHSTPPERLLPFAKQLIVKILKEEEALKDVPLTEDNILDFTLPDFSDKDERYKSCLAFIYTKCGDYLFALGEFDSAQNAYNKALKCSSLLDKHTAAACRGLSALIWSRADESASLGSAIKYLETALVAAGSPNFLQKHADELSSLDAAAGLANELLSGSDSDRIPNQEFLSAEIELGALYAKIGEREKGLSTLLKALKALYATEQASVEGVPAREKVDMLFRANTGDEAKAKFYIAELLFKLGLEDEAYDWAKMAYEIALGTYDYHVESAQIARTSLKIMARIEEMKGELEQAEKHETTARRIYEPVVQEKFCYGWRL